MNKLFESIDNLFDSDRPLIIEDLEGEDSLVVKDLTDCNEDQAWGSFTNGSFFKIENWYLEVFDEDPDTLFNTLDPKEDNVEAWSDWSNVHLVREYNTDDEMFSVVLKQVYDKCNDENKDSYDLFSTCLEENDNNESDKDLIYQIEELEKEEQENYEKYKEYKDKAEELKSHNPYDSSEVGKLFDKASHYHDLCVQATKKKRDLEDKLDGIGKYYKG